MKKSFIVFGVVGILVILLTGFFVGHLFLGSSIYSKKTIYEDDIPLPTRYGGIADSGAYTKEATQVHATSRDINSIDRKVVKNGSANIEVENFDSSVSKIKELANSFGGYITGSSMWTSGSNTKNGNITVKIPENKFEIFGDSLVQIGKVKSKETSANDVTEEYIDIQARIKNLKNQEYRYIELLSMAKSVEDVLAIEVQLGRIRSEIESYERRIKYLDNTTSYGTFYLTLNEPEKVVHEWGIKKAFNQAIDALIISIAGIIILGGFLIPIAILAGILYFVVKYVRKRIKK